jgi:hypothetical protein
MGINTFKISAERKAMMAVDGRALRLRRHVQMAGTESIHREMRSSPGQRPWRADFLRDLWTYGYMTIPIAKVVGSNKPDGLYAPPGRIYPTSRDLRGDRKTTRAGRRI